VQRPLHSRLTPRVDCETESRKKQLRRTRPHLHNISSIYLFEHRFHGEVTQRGMAARRVSLLAALGLAAAQECVMPSSVSAEYIFLTDVMGRTTYSLGDYDNCVNRTQGDPSVTTRRPRALAASPAIGVAQYCVMNAGGVQFGLCLPRSCNMPADVLNISTGIALFLIAQIELLLLLDPEDATYTCGSHAQPWTTGATAVVGVLVVSAALVVVGTAFAVWRRGRGRECGCPCARWAGESEGRNSGEDVAMFLSLPPGRGRPLLYSFDDEPGEDLDRYEYGGGAPKGDTAKEEQQPRTWASWTRTRREPRDGGHGLRCEPALASALVASLGTAAEGLARAYSLWQAVGPEAEEAEEALQNVSSARGGERGGFMGRSSQLATPAAATPPGSVARSHGGAWRTAPTTLPPEAWLTAHLPSLDGVRVLSTVWALAGYSLLYMTTPGILNVSAIIPPAGDGGSNAFQLLAGAGMAADLSLTLTGFLAVRSLLGAWGGREGGSTLARAASRLARTLPPVAFATAAFMLLAPSLGSGPFWNAFLATLAPCTGARLDVPIRTPPQGTNGADIPSASGSSSPTALGALAWTVPALANNLWPSSGGSSAVCMPWTALPALSTQLALIVAPPLVAAYTRSRTVGTALALIAIGGSLVASQEALSQYAGSGLPDFTSLATAISNPPGPWEPPSTAAYWDAFAVKPWGRAPSFLIGAVLAFVCERVASSRAAAAARRAALALAASRIQTHVRDEGGVPVPHALSPPVAWLVQGVGLGIAGAALFTPAQATGEVWSEAAVTIYSVVSGPGLALALALALFVVLTQGDGAVIGPDGGPGKGWVDTSDWQWHTRAVRRRGKGAPLPVPLPSRGEYVPPPDTRTGGQQQDELVLGVGAAKHLSISTPFPPPRFDFTSPAPLPRMVVPRVGSLIPFGPDLLLTPLASGRAWTALAPLCLPALLLGPPIILGTYSSRTQWHRYSATAIANAAAGNIFLAFAAALVVTLLITLPVARIAAGVATALRLEQRTLAVGAEVRALAVSVWSWCGARRMDSAATGGSPRRGASRSGATTVATSPRADSIASARGGSRSSGAPPSLPLASLPASRTTGSIDEHWTDITTL
jgi:hypothetical protein